MHWKALVSALCAAVLIAGCSTKDDGVRLDATPPTTPASVPAETAATSSSTASTSTSTSAARPSTSVRPLQQGLSLTAAPRTRIVDGSPVQVRGEGWPAATQIAVLQCAAASFPPSIAECDASRVLAATTDGRGWFEVRGTVVRRPVVNERRIDCVEVRCTFTAMAARDLVPITRSVASPPDYVAVGEVALEFTPATPPSSTIPLARSGPLPFDVDRDGRLDELFLIEGVLTARLATGAVVDLLASARSPNLHARTLNGQALIFYDYDGNTISSAKIATFVGGKLVQPVSADPDHEEATVVWNAHSNCCPLATVDTACLTLDGRDALVLTRSELQDRAGNALNGPNFSATGDYVRRWTRRAYVLDGARMVLVRNDSGVVEVGAPGPPGVPLDNTFSCWV